MSDDGYNYQASLKFGPNGIGMVNVRAKTAEEFLASINEAVASVGPLAVLTEAFNSEFQAVSAVAGAFQGTQVTGSYQQPAAQPQQGGAQTCQHGPMVWKVGPNPGASDNWKGWFCLAQKGDPSKCKARYDRS